MPFKIILFLSLSFISIATHSGETNEQQIKAQIEARFDALADAAQRLDHDAYLRFFDQERFTALNADGSVTHDFATFAENYRHQTGVLERYESLEFRNVKISVINSSTAVLVNEYTAKVVLHSGHTVQASGAGTQVWSRIGDTWLLVSVSSSVVRP